MAHRFETWFRPAIIHRDDGIAFALRTMEGGPPGFWYVTCGPDPDSLHTNVGRYPTLQDAIGACDAFVREG